MKEGEKLLHVLDMSSTWVSVTENTAKQCKPREHSPEGNGFKVTTLATGLLSKLLCSHLYLRRNLPTRNYKDLGTRKAKSLLIAWNPL